MDGRPVLADRERDAELRDRGYLVAPLLAPDEVRGLLDVYAALVPRGETGVRLHFLSEDRGLVRRLNAELRAVMEPAVERTFVEHTPVLLTYIVKHPGPASAFYLHRDIAVNDPRSTRCFTLWVPLVDVSAEAANGALGLVPESHLLPTGDHGFDASVLIEPYGAFLLDLIEPLTVAAGDAIVYDSRLLHASPPNVSEAARPAIGCLLARRTEALVHAVPTGRRHRCLYEIDREFFTDHQPADVAQHGMPAGYRLLDEYDEDDGLTGADLESVLGLDAPPEPVPVVPGDVATDHGVGVATMASLTARITPPARDVEVGPADLDRLGATVAAAQVLGEVGACGSRALLERGRRSAEAPPGLPDLHRLLRRPWTREAALVALGPGARLRLRFPARPGAGDDVVTVDGPRVRSGIGVAGRSTMLEVGHRVAVPSDEPVTLWNDGPGSALVLLRRIRRWPTRR